MISIGRYAFSDCRSLSKIKFEKGSALDKVGDGAFLNCYEVTSVILPKEVDTIGDGTFYDCRKLTDITMPPSLRFIGDDCFSHCKLLQRMTVYATIPPTVSDSTFHEVASGIPVYVPEDYVGAYKAAYIWREFNIQGADLPTDPIKPDDPTATDEVEAESEFVVVGNRIVFAEDTEVAVYTVSGVCVYRGVTTSVTLSHSGIYVVVTPNAATKIAIQQ